MCLTSTKREWPPAKGQLRPAAKIEALLPRLWADTRTLGNSAAQRLKKRMADGLTEVRLPLARSTPTFANGYLHVDEAGFLNRGAELRFRQRLVPPHLSMR